MGVWGGAFSRTKSGAPGQRDRGRNPPEAEALLVFGRSMEAANLATFPKLKKKQRNQISALSLQKIMRGHETGGPGAKLGVCPPRLGPNTETGQQAIDIYQISCVSLYCQLFFSPPYSDNASRIARQYGRQS